ncbi:hypothetical protein M9458_058240 [Cirrhinus mrigala]|uniref:ribonuclease H n=1 Tax=Cirrhinus mrigala TaxID=683832 RepID=A0ABD0MB27_CIRMR
MSTRDIRPTHGTGECLQGGSETNIHIAFCLRLSHGHAHNICDAAKCSSFLLQINLYIQMQPQQFPSENAKVTFLISLLTELCGAKIFTKLDLRSAYNLVRIRAGDKWKTAFITPTGHYEYRVMLYGLAISPSVFQTFMNEVFREFLHRFVVTETPVKELQRFLGFSNFYCRFIKDYSSITAPLTSLLRGKPKHLGWNPAAHGAFQQLKTIFSTAPLLHYPDPDHPFTVEVDASTVGVGAVLSLVLGESSLLHPCAFFSRKLSPAEQNYDVGNRELLPIKLALEEWGHWLEGANHPFTIITDHKNLRYLREAK